ncbi:hypothetical protein M758_UG061200 [Ceratodon purpureus]|nr:hypothetical protein M758_UG061200 [Ceratodon purpureus]
MTSNNLEETSFVTGVQDRFWHVIFLWTVNQTLSMSQLYWQFSQNRPKTPPRHGQILPHQLFLLQYVRTDFQPAVPCPLTTA